MTVQGHVLAALAMTLFAWSGSVCLQRMLQGEESEVLAPADRSERRNVFIITLAVALAYQLIVCFFAMREFPGVGIEKALQSFLARNIDVRHYLDIAQFGYGTGAEFYEQELMIVFFPLWPWIWKLFTLNGLLPWHITGMALQLVMVCFAAQMIFELLRRNYGSSAAGWTLAFLAVSPAAVFCFIPMTESLFLLLTASFFLLLEREKYPQAALVGFLAALSRSPGALLAGVSVIWLISNRKKLSLSRALAVAGPAAGLVVYLGINKAVYDNWLQFSIVQKEHWNQGMGMFTETINYELKYYASYLEQGNTDMAYFLFLAAAITVLMCFVLLALGAMRFKSHHLAYGLAYSIFTMGATWLLSAPRYAMVLFFLPASIAVTVKSKYFRFVILVILMVLGMLYASVFLRHGPIY